MQPETAFEIRVLGSIEVLVDGVPAALGGPRQVAVLAHLVLRAGRPVAAGELARAVWGDELPASAATTLRGYVKHLRRALLGTPAAIVTIGSAYRLVVDEACIDAVRFERAVLDGRGLLGVDAAGASDRLAEALTWWRGPAYADIDDNVDLEQESRRLDALHLLAVETEIEALLAVGGSSALVPRLEVLRREHPLHEGFCSQLMRAWAASGRRAEALRTYGDLRRDLVSELGMEPGSALQAVELEILVEEQHDRAPAEPTPLPEEATPFVGRLADVVRTLDALAESRLTTITGAGGIGKTRLALAVAAEAGAATSVPFVELASVADGDEASAAVAAVLHVTAAPALQVAGIVAALAGTPTLLVLDNCEHVIASAASLVHDLLRRCPEVRVLATSREPLGLSGERVIELGGLCLPAGPEAHEILASDAGRMFAARARAMSGFELDATNATAVAEICARLDGVPLAIELTVPALRALTVDELASALREHDGPLVTWSTRRAGPARHRALADAIDWSFQLLTPRERSLLCSLSVFADRFALADAGAVCPDDIPLVETLIGLVSKSMVTRLGDGAGSFRLLVPIRSFAGQQLDASGAAASARARHARHFLAIAQELGGCMRGPDEVPAAGRLDGWRDDLRAALAWFLRTEDGIAAGRMASALWLYWDRRFDVRYARDSIDAVLRLEVEKPVRLDLLAGALHLAWLSDDLEPGARYFEEGLALLSQEDLAERGRLLVTVAELRRGMNHDSRELDALITEAAQLLCVAGDLWWEAHALRVSSLLAVDLGEYERAALMAQRALALWEVCGDGECTSGPHLLLAVLALENGDPATARAEAALALAGFRAVVELTGESATLRACAAIHAEQRDLVAAEAAGREALEVAVQADFARGRAEALKALADVALLDGRPIDALALASEAVERFRARVFEGDVNLALSSLAAASLAVGDVQGAARACRDGLGVVRQGRHPRCAAQFLRILGLAEAALGRLDVADASVREALEWAERRGNPRVITECLVASAEVALRRGEVDRAVDELGTALRLGTEARLALSPIESEARATLLAAVRAEAGERADVLDGSVVVSGVG